MKRFAALLTASLMSLSLFSSPVSANSFTTDLTDLWWNASESGWGVTVTHQRDVIFLTFFVYGSDNRPTFYTATASYSGESSGGALNFNGPMYQTTGPWFGGPFNPGSVTTRQVGTATFNAFVESATLTYTVDGTSVTKALTRETFRNNELSGNFVGAFRESTTGCANPANNGISESIVGATISHSASTFAMSTNENGFICNWSGNYRQAGRMGGSSGTYNCGTLMGTYDMVEIEANPQGITGRYTAQDNACSQISGRFAIVIR